MAYTIRQESFASVIGPWQALLSTCSLDTVFLTPQWQQTWWHQFGQEDELCLLGVWKDSTLEGLAPLMRRNGTISFLGGTDLVDYHDFLVPQEQEECLYTALFNHLDGLAWSTLDLSSLPGSSPTLRRLPDLARARSYRVELEPEDVSPGTALPESWDEYLAGLTKKDRHELRRKLRRLEGAGEVHTYIARDPDQLSQALDDFFRLLRQSRGDKADFLTPEREQFFRAMAKELLDAGIFSLFFLELDGQRVAATICLDYNDTRFLYNSGYNPSYARLSVGLLLKALCLKDAIEHGMRYFDFLRGAEEYKYDLGAQDTQLYHLVIQRSSP